MKKFVYGLYALVAVVAVYFYYFPRAQSVNVACETTKGRIEIQVHPQWSPTGAKRFLELVDEGFYQNVPLFRCVENFICQFGAIPPRVGAKIYSPISDDPKIPELRNFKRGYLSFAGSGPDSRSTHVFVALADGIQSLGSMPWETPFAEITSESFQQTVSQWNKSYGEMAPWGQGPDAQKIETAGGDEYLKANFPNLDYIQSCSRL